MSFSRHLIWMSPFLVTACSADDDLFYVDPTLDATTSAALADESASDGADVDVTMGESCRPLVLKEEVIAAFDADGDGVLSIAEEDALAADLESRDRPGHRLRHMLWVYDLDESYDLDDSERAELEADLEARCENKTAWLLANFDVDGDAALNAEERAAARAELEALHADWHGDCHGGAPGAGAGGRHRGPPPMGEDGAPPPPPTDADGNPLAPPADADGNPLLPSDDDGNLMLPVDDNGDAILPFGAEFDDDGNLVFSAGAEPGQLPPMLGDGGPRAGHGPGPGAHMGPPPHCADDLDACRAEARARVRGEAQFALDVDDDVSAE